MAPFADCSKFSVPASDIAKRAIRHQPLTYARTVLHNFARGFAPMRTRHDGELPSGRSHLLIPPAAALAVTALVRRRRVEGAS